MSYPQDRPGALPSAFEDVPSQGAKKTINEIDELLQGWNNRLSIKNLALAKRYSEREIEVVVVIVGQQSAPCPAEKYCAVFRKKGFFAQDLWRFGRLKGAVGSSWADRSRDLMMNACHWDEKYVLVENIKLVQLPEGPVPSCVWLGKFDEVHDFIGGAVQEGSDIVSGKLGF